MTTADRRTATARWGSAAVAAVGLALLTACSGSSSTPSAAATGATTPGSTSSTVPSPTSSSSGSPSGSSSTSSSSSSSTASVPQTTVAPRTRATRTPQPITGTATFTPGVTVAVAEAKALTVTGHGPGELSGPAVAFTLRLRNGTPAPLDLSRAVVTCSYGRAATPCDDSQSAPSKPWSGRGATGSSSDGTYVFLIPSDQRSAVELSISYAPDQPVVLLRGRA
jgi:hypothetical protein